MDREQLLDYYATEITEDIGAIIRNGPGGWDIIDIYYDDIKKKVKEHLKDVYEGTDEEFWNAQPNWG